MKLIDDIKVIENEILLTINGSVLNKFNKEQVNKRLTESLRKLNNLKMGIQLDKHAYEKLIQEDIEELNKHMSEHSLERKHIVAVLEWSVNQIYPDMKCNEPVPNCPICDSRRVNLVEHGYKHCTNCGNHWL